MNIDTERVIAEVRLRPALWNLSNELYKDRDARSKFWLEVFEALFPDYKNEADSKKKEIEKIVQQRWKTARDAYIRCKNILKNSPSGPGAGKRKVYIYYENMKFLDKKHRVKVKDSIETNQTSASSIKSISIISNYDMPSASSQDIPMSTGVEVNKELYKSVTQENSPGSRFRYKHFENKTLKESHKRKRRKKQTDNDQFDKEMFIMLKDNAKLFKNDDMNFFMSLLPITEKFTTHQKLIFRTEMLKKIMEISNMPNPYEITSRPNSATSYFSQQSDSILNSQQDPINVQEYQTLPDMSNTVKQECELNGVRSTSSYTSNLDPKLFLEDT